MAGSGLDRLRVAFRSRLADSPGGQNVRGLEVGEEEVFGVDAPALDGVGADEGGSLAFGFVAHEQGIAVGEVGGDFAVVG